MRRLRTTAHLVMAALLGFVSTTFAATPAAAVPPYTVEERAAAIASPALIFVDIGLEGFLRTRGTGQPMHDKPVTVHSRCSGIVVGTDGFVITPTHCVSLRADSLRSAAGSLVAGDLIRDGRLASDQRQAFIDNVQNTAEFTATLTTNDPPTPKVLAQAFIGSSDANIPGRVVASQSAEDGDLTLLKLDVKGLPVAKLTKASFTAGMSVVLVGFILADASAPAPTFTAQWRVQHILGPYDSPHPWVAFRHDGDLGNYSHGGMVLDNDGNVIGMITGDVSSNNRGPKLAHDSADLLALLSESRVTNQQTDLDRTYRAGLDAYFTGHYRDAIKNFDTVLAIQSDNVLAITYREHASVRMAIEGDDNPAGPSLSPLLLIGGSGLAVLVIVVLVAALVVRSLRLRSREREIAQYEAYLPVSGLPVSGLPISSVPTSGIAPASGAPMSGVPVSTGTPWVSNTGSWVVPVSTPPGYAVPDQTGAPEYVPPASPTTPTAEAPPDGSQDTSANWPAVTVWRTPEGEGAEAPPAPQQRVKTNPWGPPPQETPPGS
jgi:hypothetical protein